MFVSRFVGGRSKRRSSLPMPLDFTGLRCNFLLISIAKCLFITFWNSSKSGSIVKQVKIVVTIYSFFGYVHEHKNRINFITIFILSSIDEGEMFSLI